MTVISYTFSFEIVSLCVRRTTSVHTSEHQDHKSQEDFAVDDEETAVGGGG
ncbi:hypothetical protein L798_06235 [Zootermopsis nevadensis]|uniref:Uncharacterized protein n=1 Tax=Zootermopsis nevadensis TaxID=136037 RepID=A0A067R749_ZOONE|nr:hypothetical protein L798_06235 [Zootermopsis nevadensis]